MKSEKPATPKKAFVFVDDADEEHELTWKDVIRPTGTINFCTMWLVSRPMRLLLAGLPFVLVVGGGTVFALWLRQAPADGLIVRFEQGIQDAIEDEQTDHALVLMNGLIHLRPNQQRYQFNRAWLLLEEGQTQAGLSTMLNITPVDDRGFVPARLWLVRQSLATPPVLEMSHDDRLGQMRRAVAEEPGNLEAHRLLATLYLSQNQLRLAEVHLAEVVDEHPELALDLARIQQRIGRDNKEVSRSYETAQEYFSTRLQENPHSTADRIGWVQCMVAQDQLAEAEALLREGLQSAPDEKLQHALAEIQARYAATSLAQSTANAPQATEFLLKSLNLNPNNGQALSLLFLLSDMGVVIDREKLAPLVELYKARQDDEATATLQNVIVLTGLLKASGDTRRAVDLLKPLVDDEPSLRLVLAQLSESIGDVKESRRLVDEVLQETEKQLVESPGDLSVLVNHANALNIAHRFSDAIQALDLYLAEAEQTAREQPAGFRRVYGTACLGLFDQSEDEERAGNRVQLLTTTLTVGHNANAAIQRLAALCVSDGKNAAKAESVLNQLATNGKLSAAVYLQIGDAAMKEGQAARAVRYYDRARATKPDDATILNNLAFALISHSPDNAKRALEFAEAALTASPYHPDLLVTRAEIYISMEQWEDARLDLDAALESRSTSADVHRLLVKAYTGLNEPTLAAEHQRILTKLKGN